MQLTESRPAPSSSVKLVVGLFFTALGILLTLENLDVLDAGRILRYWPALLILIGVLKFRETSNRILAVIAIAAGSLLLIANLHLLHFSIFTLWPVILIAIGALIVLRSFGLGLPQFGRDGDATIVSVMTHRKLISDGRDINGKRFVTFMGGTEIELNNDNPSTEPVVIEIFAMVGGVEIRVPRGWEVVADVVAIMGGVDVKTRSDRSERTGRKLIVRGLVTMAGAEIKEARES